MRTITCIAIDDEPMALLVIEQFCRRKGGMELTTYSELMLVWRKFAAESQIWCSWIFR